MANRDTAGFGLRAGMRVGNTPAISGQSKYAIKSGLGVGTVSYTHLTLPTTTIV